jgi:hypothetical protein
LFLASATANVEERGIKKKKKKKKRERERER